MWLCRLRQRWHSGRLGLEHDEDVRAGGGSFHVNKELQRSAVASEQHRSVSLTRRSPAINPAHLALSGRPVFSASPR